MSFLTFLLCLGALATAGAADAQSAQSASRAVPKSIIGAPGAPVVRAPVPEGQSTDEAQTGALAGQSASAKAEGFATQAAEAGLAEVEFSKLASVRATVPEVKNLANEMVRDHGKANEELASVASKQGIKGPPTLTDEHAASLRSLSQQSGAAFDRAYLQQMVTDHQAAISLFEQEAKDSNAPLAQFASRTLPTLRHHAKRVAQLARH